MINYMKSIYNIIGCTGGIIGYYASKTALLAANVNRKSRPLKPATINKMTPLFPSLEMNHVQIRTGCTLPANWIPKNTRVRAMTFGVTIYFGVNEVENTYKGLHLLMHELVHVDQVRRLGSERRFACEYGKGYLAGGCYEKIPLEMEAFEFVRNHRIL